MACLVVLLLGAGWLLADPACAGKEAITGPDLDRVSAAGVCGTTDAHACGSSEESGSAQDPTAAQDTSRLRIDAAARYHRGFGAGAQQGTQALILNNAVGTNQIANGINISGGGAR